VNENIKKIIIDEMQPLISEKGFSEKDGVYSNSEYAFKVEHDSDAKLLKLLVATVENNEIKDFSEASAFLFEDEENVKDARSAGLDFLDTAKIKFGIKAGRYQGANIALPKSTSQTPDVEALTAKILNIYPEFKDTYKEHVSTYGAFLYIDFYKTYIAPKVKEVIDGGNKKQITKLMGVLSEMFNEGDKMVGDVIVGVILTGAADFDKQREEIIISYLQEHKYLKTATQSFFALAHKDKKIKQMLS